ncbi:MAG: hypothetical protein JST59_04670 [Actinobacteria bacterium]|nr:hypothetical protein [Actinomycetota bacterium]
MPAVRINECTLREGMQAANGPFSEEQSVEVARLLVRLGVDAIECGHPASASASAGGGRTRRASPRWPST